MVRPQPSTEEKGRRRLSLGRRVFDELMYGGHMLGLGTSALAFTSALLLGYTPTAGLLLTAYLFTYASYTLNRMRELRQDLISNPERVRHLIHREYYLKTVIAASYISAFFIAFMTSLAFFTALLVPLILSYLYNIGSKRLVLVLGVSKLKEKLLVKNITVSAGWGLTAFLTLIYFDGPFTATVLAVFTFISLRLFVNTVFCDIRDVEGDTVAGIKTIPMILGVKRTRLLLLIVNTISGLFIISAVSGGILPPMAHFVNLVTIYAYYYILRSCSPKADMVYLTDFIADGEMLVTVPLALLGKLVLQV